MSKDISAPPVSGQTPEGIEVTTGDMKVYITGGTAQESAKLAGVIFNFGAPVSRQGATLPQMTEQQVADALVENDPLTMVTIRRLLNGDPVTINLPQLTRIVGHCIDSRPRSEDSRAKALEAARIAYASEFPPNADGEPDVGSIHANIRKLKAALAGDSPDGYIAVAMIGSEYTSVAFKDVETARAMCVKGGITPFWTGALASTTPQKADNE